VLFLLIFMYVGWPQLLRGRRHADVLARLNPFLLVLAIGLELLSLLSYTVLTRVTLPAKPHLSLFTLFRIQMSTKALGNLVPGGSAAGGTLGYRLLTAADVPGPAAGFSLATVGLASAVVLNLMLWVALVVSIPFNGFSRTYVIVAIVGVFIMAAAAGLVLLLMRGADMAETVFRAIARRVPLVDEETASRVVHQIAARLHDLAGQPELIRRGALWAAANWTLDAATLWVFVRAFSGQAMNPVNLLVAYGVANVLAAIPLTPGGLGVVEATLTPTLVSFGVPITEATIAVLAWRVAQFWLPIPIGGIAYGSLRFGQLGRRSGVDRAVKAPLAEGAERRVWDEATGEYRVVRPSDGSAA
ncbi:MAG TPA: lysylphosphatidylglycerol synthase transmembrane domain-containing protein, partial [Acidimicrobiales bacterium]